MNAAILTDTTKCIGCNECGIACKKVNRLPPDSPRRWDLDDGLSARNWTSIVEGPKHSFARKQCRHCLSPACVSACPVGALSKTEIGAVVYDSTKCMGCRYCMMACAYGIPRYDWDQTVPYVRKCILCYDRIRDGRAAGLHRSLPNQGDHLRRPRCFACGSPQPHFRKPRPLCQQGLGEYELGGTSVLYISNVDLSFLSSENPSGSAPLPETTALAMHAVPFVFTGVLAGMAGLNWVIQRRIKIQSEGSND